MPVFNKHKHIVTHSVRKALRMQQHKAQRKAQRRLRNQQRKREMHTASAITSAQEGELTAIVPQQPATAVPEQPVTVVPPQQHAAGSAATAATTLLTMSIQQDSTQDGVMPLEESLEPTAALPEQHAAAATTLLTMIASNTQQHNNTQQGAVLISKQTISESINNEIKVYFTSICGGGHDTKWVRLLASRTSDLILFAAALLPLAGTRLCNAFDALAFFALILSMHSAMFLQYTDHLQSDAQLKQDTIRIHLLGYQQLFRWIYIVQNELICKVDESTYARVNTMFTNIYLNIGRGKRRDARTDTTTDIDYLIANHKWPVGGVSDIRVALEKEAQWIQATSMSTYVIKEAYLRYVSFLIVHIITYSPQGRIGGIQATTKADGDRLLRNGKKL